MANCTNCGAEILKESLFCAQCGQQIESNNEKIEGTLVTLKLIPEEELVTPTNDTAESNLKRTSLFKRIGTIKVILLGIIVVLGIGGIVFGVARQSALVKSTAAFNRAQIDVKNGQLDNALKDLSLVVPYDAHFQDAQKQVTEIKQANDIIALMNNFVEGSSKYDSVLSAFWNDYNNSIDPLNTVWKNYTSYYVTDFQPLLNTAELPVSKLGTDSENLNQVVGGLALYLGTARTNPLISSYDTSTLSLNYTDSSNEAKKMNDAISNELSSFRNNLFVYNTVSQSIGDTNTANRKLKEDQTKVDQASAEFVGYLTGLIKKLLGQEININNVITIHGSDSQAGSIPKNSMSLSSSSVTQSSNASTAATNSNTHYTNSRYEFSIDYPSTFSIQDTPPTNGDGIKVYTSDKSANITIYGLNVLDWDVNYYYQQELKAHTNVTYKTQDSNWYVVSWVDGDSIGYTKGIVGKGSVNAFEIQYPRSEQQSYNDVIKLLSNSFKTPGIDVAH